MAKKRDNDDNIILSKRDNRGKGLLSIIIEQFKNKQNNLDKVKKIIELLFDAHDDKEENKDLVRSFIATDEDDKMHSIQYSVLTEAGFNSQLYAYIEKKCQEIRSLEQN